MKCKQVQELAGAYLYGDLAPQEMRAVRMHAQQCHACREDLRARGAVAASIPNDAPQLTDDERQRIMWSVKGAIKAETPAKSLFGFRFSPAYALAAAAVLVVVGIKVVGSLPHTQVNAPRATVRVTEELAPAPTKDSNIAANNNDSAGDSSASKQERRRFKLDIGPLLDRRPQVGVISRNHQDKHPAVVTPEPPAPVVDTPQSPDVKESTDDTRLPDPNESNNANKTPTEPEVPADNSGDATTGNP